DPQPSSGKCGDAGKAHTRGVGDERVVQRGASALSGTRAAASRARSGRAARHARNAVGRPRKATDPGDGSALTAHEGPTSAAPAASPARPIGNLAPSEKKLDRKSARMRLPPAHTTTLRGRRGGARIVLSVSPCAD
ncbi:unnamed protein product, partial [Ixodes pacificus]